MSTGLHADAERDEVHAPYRAKFADASARLADAGPYTATDVERGVRALQADTLGEYILTDDSPVTWTAIPATSVPTHGSTHESAGSDPIASLPTAGEKAALPGTSGTPGAGNKYVTNADPRNTNARTPTGAAGGDLGGTYASPKVVAITETGGPLSLPIGAIAEGDFLKRVGSAIVGVASSILTHALGGASHTPATLAELNALVSDADLVPQARTLTAGSGLSGGGDLTTDRTFDVNVDGATVEISTDTVQVKDNGITDAKLRDSAALSVIGRSANTTGDPADIAAGADGEVLRRSGTTLGFGTIATAGIGANQVTNAKLAQMAAHTFKGNNTGATADPIDLTITQLKTELGINTRELFFAGVDYAANLGDYRTKTQAAGGTQRYTFAIPANFVSLVSVELIGITTSGGSATADIDLTSDYGAVGETSSVNSESNTTNTYDMSGTNTIRAVSLSSVLSAIAAGDFVGVAVIHNAIGTAMDYLGVRLKYNT